MQTKTPSQFQTAFSPFAAAWVCNMMMIAYPHLSHGGENLRSAETRARATLSASSFLFTILAFKKRLKLKL